MDISGRFTFWLAGTALISVQTGDSVAYCSFSLPLTNTVTCQCVCDCVQHSDSDNNLTDGGKKDLLSL